MKGLPTTTICLSVLCLGNPGLRNTAESFPFILDAPLGAYLANADGNWRIGDINGDKLDDIVATNYSEVVVLLNSGNGSFKAAVAYPTPNGTDDVQLGDFNGDQISDIIVTSSSGISVLLGNGDGTFQMPINTAGSGGYMTIGDFNGDGKLDVAVAGGNVQVMLGNGDGTFTTGQNLGVEINAGFVIAADFNGDGRLDLAVSGGADIIVLLGFGNGSFGSAREYATGANALMLTSGDVNSDGIRDLVVLTNGGCSVLLGVGHGIFKQAQNYSGLSNPVSAVLKDFNGDGRLDLVTATTTPGYLDPLSATIEVSFGKGDGTFAAPSSYSAGNGAPAGALHALGTGIFNSNGERNIAVVGAGYGGAVYVLASKKNGEFVQPPSLSTNGAGAAALADFDRNGTLDIAEYNGVDVTMSERGDRQFKRGQVYPVSSGGGASIATADVNGDGIADLVVAAGGPDTNIHVLIGNGDGTLSLRSHRVSETAPLQALRWAI